MTTLTEELIEQARSKNGGWSKQQLEIIGVDWPPTKGWKKNITGEKFKESKINAFIELKNDHI